MNVRRGGFGTGLVRRKGSGQGLPQDSIEVYKWLDIAALRIADWERENVVQNRDRIAAKMAQQQIAEVQKLAREWRPK